jgi:galactokinase/mevalonate kinase-like predicted kinase
LIITHTAHRISFFGGVTDYPIWYLRYGGAVLSTAIDKRLLYRRELEFPIRLLDQKRQGFTLDVTVRPEMTQHRLSETLAGWW